MLLLDTCTLIWLASAQAELSERAVQLLSNSTNKKFFSAISAFEIGLKVAKNLLVFPIPLREWLDTAIETYDLIELPVSREIALVSTELPFIHRDPVDRLLIATSIYHNLKLVTSDKQIQNYPSVKVEW